MTTSFYYAQTITTVTNEKVRKLSSVIKKKDVLDITKLKISGTMNSEDFAYLGSIKEFDEHGLAPTTSTLILQLSLDMIASTVSSNIDFERYEFLKLHPGGALGQMLREEIKKDS